MACHFLAVLLTSLTPSHPFGPLLAALVFGSSSRVPGIIYFSGLRVDEICGVVPDIAYTNQRKCITTTISGVCVCVCGGGGGGAEGGRARDGGGVSLFQESATKRALTHSRPQQTPVSREEEAEDSRAPLYDFIDGARGSRRLRWSSGNRLLDLLRSPFDGGPLSSSCCLAFCSSVLLKSFFFVLFFSLYRSPNFYV